MAQTLKRLLSFALALVMVLGLFPVIQTEAKAAIVDLTAPTAPEGINNPITTTADAGTVNAPCKACGLASVAWEPLDATTSAYYSDGSSHHYYVPVGGLTNTASVSYRGNHMFRLEKNSKVCLHLNSQDLTTTGNVLVVDAVFNLMGTGNWVSNSDFSVSGYTYYGYNVTSYNSKAMINLYGGTLTATNGTYSLGAVAGDAATDERYGVNIYPGVTVNDAIYQCGGRFNMYGGTLNGTIGIDSYVDGSRLVNVDFNMFGGEITKRVRVTSGSFDMYGGVISGELAIQNGKFQNTGKTVTCYSSSAFSMSDGEVNNRITMVENTDAANNGTMLFRMTGGEINGLGTESARTASKGAALYADAGRVELVGGVVNGGYSSANGGAIYLFGDTVLSIEGATINGGNTTASGGAVYMDGTSTCYMSAGTVQDGVAAEGGNFCLGTANNAVVMTGGLVTRGKATTTLTNAWNGGGNFLLSNNSTLSVTNATISEGETTNTGIGGNIMGRSHTVVDLNNGAILKDGYARGGWGGGNYAGSDGILNIYTGAQVLGGGNPGASPKSISLLYSSVLNVKGGTLGVPGDLTAYTSGKLQAYACSYGSSGAGAKINVYGGVVYGRLYTDNTYGGTKDVDAQLIVYDGTVWGASFTPLTSSPAPILYHGVFGANPTQFADGKLVYHNPETNLYELHVATGVETPADCENDGYTTYTCTYSNTEHNLSCNDVVVVPGETSQGHTWGEEIPAVVATCNAKGNAAYYECADCDAYAVKVDGEYVIKTMEQIETPIDEDNHAYGEWVEGVKTCSRCKDTVSCEHAWSDWTSVDETNHTRACATCKVSETKTHEYGEEPASTTDGNCVDKATETYKCSGCGAEKVVTGEVNANVHKSEAVLDTNSVKEATCYADGFTGNKICPDCKVVVTEGTAISKDTVAHNVKYTDITETHHTAFCDVTECEWSEIVAHTYVEGKCVCGAEEAADVVKVGDKGYKSLMEAWQNAKSGDTITLLADVDVTGFEEGTFVPVSGMTLDLNNNTLFVPFRALAFAGDNFTIKNGTVDSKGASYGLWIGANIMPSTKVLVENVTVNGGVHVKNATGVTLKNMTVNADVAGTTNDYYAVYAELGSAVTVESGSYKAAAGVAAVYGPVTVNGGSFSSNVTQKCVTGNHTVSNGEMYVFGAHAYEKAETVAPDFGTEGYTWYTCACGDSYKGDIVAAKVAVAEVNGTKYESLAAAVAEAEENDVIVLLDNVTVTAPVLVPTGVAVDLNGKVLTGTVLGTLQMNGGLLVTAEGYKMFGVGADYYATVNAELFMDAAGTIKLVSGEVTLVMNEWWSLPGQYLVVGEGATFTIPTGKVLQINGTKVVVEGTAVVDGAVNLYSVDATIQAAEGLNVTTQLADYDVIYANGVYSLKHKPVVVVKPENVTVGGNAVTEEQKDAVEEIVDQVVQNQATDKVETGLKTNDKANEALKQELQAAGKTEEQAEKAVQNAQTAVIIELKDVVLSEENKATKLTYDVEPVLVYEDQQVKIENTGKIKFHLPVPGYIAAGTSVKVYHDKDLLGFFQVKTDGNGHNYVEVEHDEFSPYSVELSDAVALLGEVEYTSFLDAMEAAAVNGGTVKLLQNVGVSEILMVMDNVTLDLNGFTLSSSSYVMAVFENSYIIDSSEGNTGRLNMDISKLRLLNDNVQLPVQTANGIMFADVAIEGKWSVTSNCFKFWFADSTDAAFVNQLKQGAADSKLKVQVELTWNGGASKMVYEYNDATLNAYLANWTAYSLTMNVNGADSISDLSYTASVVFADGTDAEAFVSGSSVSRGV